MTALLFDPHELLGMGEGSPLVDVIVVKGVTVRVTLEDVVHERGGTRKAFVVAGSTGYRAVLPYCWCQDEEKPLRSPCDLEYGHSVDGGASEKHRHNSSHCHAWHRGAARRFGRKVAATYGEGAAVPEKQSREIGVPRGTYAVKPV